MKQTCGLWERTVQYRYEGPIRQWVGRERTRNRMKDRERERERERERDRKRQKERRTEREGDLISNIPPLYF